MPLDTNIATALSRGFDRGNYANAYEADDLSVAFEQNESEFESRSGSELDAFRGGFVLGFFSSYEREEVPSEYLLDYDDAYIRWASSAKEIGIAVD